MTETEEFLGDVDEDLEAMQGTVYLLQQELKDAKERLQRQQLELDQLRNITAGNMNSMPAAACGALSAAATVNTLTTESDSSDVLMKQTGKMSSELLRTGGRDSNRMLDEKFIKREPEDTFVYGHQRNALDDSNRIQTMDVGDSEIAANCSYSNDVRTSPIVHDDSLSSEQLPGGSGLRKTMVDRFRTASKVGAAELASSDCVPNGRDDDKAVAVAGN